MKIAQGIIMGAWLIVGLNLLMAFGAIGIFMRMTPAIANIISRNERSLKACEEMLETLALSKCQRENKKILLEQFSAALERARNNITEQHEPAAIAEITDKYIAAFDGDENALEATVKSTVKLAKLNREAMEHADLNAQQLGKGGAWGIVFMASCTFLAGVVFIRNLNSKLIEPLKEIKTVLIAYQNGETRRRCAGKNLSADFRAIFGSLNTVLDQAMIFSDPRSRKNQ
ncbi:MAG: hypothetical protein Kow0029_01160 [Candidatus Rifleibacteriota bacterium]